MNVGRVPRAPKPLRNSRQARPDCLRKVGRVDFLAPHFAFATKHILPAVRVADVQTRLVLVKAGPIVVKVVEVPGCWVVADVDECLVASRDDFRGTDVPVERRGAGDVRTAPDVHDG